MTRQDFLKNLKSPLPNAILKKFPQGNIMQLWGESADLYSAAFGFKDDVHRYLGGHSGLDISTHQGDTVVAAHDGEIEMLQTDPISTGGLMVYLLSDPLDGETVGNSRVQTIYAHLSKILVMKGQKIKQGDPLGLEGNTGFVVSGDTSYWGNAPSGVGTHLHFGLHELVLNNGALTQRYNNPLQGTSDPLPYLTGDYSGEVGLLKQMLLLLQKWYGRN